MALQSDADLRLLNALVPVRFLFWPFVPVCNFAFINIRILLSCDRASWHVTVHRDMWPCIVTCYSASWHVTVHRDMWPCIVKNFLIIKPTRCTNLSNLFWKWKSTCFGQFLCPSSGVIHCKLSNGVCHTGSILILLLLGSCLQTCMTYTIAECTVNNSWWWTEELSETCRVSFPK
jgi:hypothetical protein